MSAGLALVISWVNRKPAMDSKPGQCRTQHTLCAGTRLAFAVFQACYADDAPTLMATVAALLLPDANAALDTRVEAIAGDSCQKMDHHEAECPKLAPSC